MDLREKISSVVISRDGGIIAAICSGDDFIRLLDIRRSRLIFLKGRWYAESLAISEDGKILASGWTDGGIRLWSASGKLVGELPNCCSGVSCLSFSCDGALLIAGDHAGRTSLWEIGSHQLVWESSHYLFSASDVFLSPDRRIAVTRYLDDLLRVWKADTGDQLWKAPYVKRVSFHPGGDRLVVMLSNAVQMRTLSGKIIWEWDDENWGNRIVSLSPDGSLLAVGSKLGYVTVLDAERGNVLWKLTDFKDDAPRCLFFSRRWLAVGGDSGLVQVFSETGKRLWKGAISKTPIIRIGTFSDGRSKRLISVDQYGVVAVWDVSDGSLLWLSQL